MENNKNNTPKVSLSKVKAVDEKIIVPNTALGIDKHIVTYYQPKGAVAEQYRTLRTNLRRINKEDPVKCIVMTSSIHNEGKSTTSLNLAIAMTYELDKKILIIDADMRKGRLHEMLGLTNIKGISNFLEAEANEDDIIRKTPIHGLDLVT